MLRGAHLRCRGCVGGGGALLGVRGGRGGHGQGGGGGRDLTGGGVLGGVQLSSVNQAELDKFPCICDPQVSPR